MLPNFFIIGAPKCGTTSLNHYLSQHRNIYMSDCKEPYYFNTDSSHRHYYDKDSYLNLFKLATEEHVAIGEASSLYLYSKEAVRNILEFNPSAKFIVMLRNPVEMAYAWHSQMLFEKQENIKSFKTAWAVQDKRKEGGLIGKNCRDSRLLLYGEISKLGQQLERVYKYVPRKQVLVILLDNMKKDPASVYSSVLSFLGVESDKRSTFPVLNENKVERIELLSTALSALSNSLGNIKKSLEIRHTGLLSPIYKFSIVKQRRDELDPNLRAELSEYFRNDIKKLSGLIERNLTHWK